MLRRPGSPRPRPGQSLPAPRPLPLSTPPRPQGLPLVRFVYHRPGKGTRVFEERLLADHPDLKVLEVSRYDGPAVRVRERVVLEVGARALWFVIPGAWYDLGRFHLADGTVTGWYTNFCTPVVLDAEEWTSTDLFLDHWLSVEGWGTWLDEPELARGAGARLLTQDMLTRLGEECSKVARLLAAGAWPPPSVLSGWESPPPGRPGSDLKPGEV